MNDVIKKMRQTHQLNSNLTDNRLSTRTVDSRFNLTENVYYVYLWILNSYLY